jgi:hypothetical protein
MTDRDISQLITELKELKLKELQVLATIESLIQQAEVTQGTLIIPGDPTFFQVGDRVVIINKVRRPLNRSVNNGDRTAVVIKVSEGRIDLKTSNGFSTWRAPQNLRHRTQDE